jgi:hypothetical protein
MLICTFPTWTLSAGRAFAVVSSDMFASTDYCDCCRYRHR